MPIPMPTTTITTDQPTTAAEPSKSPSDDALQFLWLLRAIHRKRGPEGLLDLADHYEREDDPLYADIPRLLRAVAYGDPSNERWDETFSVATAAADAAAAAAAAAAAEVK